MRIALAADHRGYAAKRRLAQVLRQWGHEVEDFGCHTAARSSDYPDFAVPAAGAVAGGRFDVAILLDGSGIGMCIAANKIAGIRAALAHDEVTAHIAREQIHCNVLCLGADLLSEAGLTRIVQVFLNTQFGEGRHARRVEKLKALDRGAPPASSPPDGSMPATRAGASAGAQ